MQLSIFVSSGRNTSYVYKSAYTEFSQQGFPVGGSEGVRFRPTTVYGKMRDVDTDEVVVGIRRPGLAQSSKMRKNRAQAEFVLADLVKQARRQGCDDFKTERDVLDWFLEKHGGKRGVTWNVYETDSGRLLSDAEVEGTEAVEKAPPGTHKAKRPDDFDDSEYVIHDKKRKEWSCLACNKGPVKTGLHGHRNSKAHVANVVQAQKEQQIPSTAVGAA